MNTYLLFLILSLFLLVNYCSAQDCDAIVVTPYITCIVENGEYTGQAQVEVSVIGGSGSEIVTSNPPLSQIYNDGESYNVNIGVNDGTCIFTDNLSGVVDCSSCGPNPIFLNGMLAICPDSTVDMASVNSNYIYPPYYPDLGVGSYQLLFYDASGCLLVEDWSIGTIALFPDFPIIECETNEFGNTGFANVVLSGVTDFLYGFPAPVNNFTYEVNITNGSSFYHGNYVEYTLTVGGPGYDCTFDFDFTATVDCEPAVPPCNPGDFIED